MNDFRLEDGGVGFLSKAADALIDLIHGAVSTDRDAQGWVAALNDLHKCRDAGKVWSRLIDASVALMDGRFNFGLLPIFFLRKGRLSGLLALSAGAILCDLAYSA